MSVETFNPQQRRCMDVASSGGSCAAPAEPRRPALRLAVKQSIARASVRFDYVEAPEPADTAYVLKGADDLR